MTVDEFLRGRQAFTSGAVKRNPSIARAERAKFQADITDARRREFMANGVSPALAKQQAALDASAKMKTLAALHNPDMVSAGADKISDFGDRQVNSKIGAQWRSRVASLDAAAQRVPMHQRGANMSAELERCK